MCGGCLSPLLKAVRNVYIKDENGQAIVEFALVLPLLLLLVCGIIDFGWIFGNQLMANNACREATRYSAIHYNDSDADNDQTVATQIITNSAPTLISPMVTLTKSTADDSVKVVVTSQVNVLTPILSSFFPDGKYTVSAQCVMKLE